MKSALKHTATTKTCQVGTHQVSILKKIGEGGQSKIYLCKDLETGTRCVLKKTKPDSQNQMNAAQREIALVKQMKHPNIVLYIDSDISQKKMKNNRFIHVVSLLLEYYPNGDLLKYSNRRREEGLFMEEPEILRLFVQMCRACDYLHRHSPPLAHRDIKLENFLIGNSGRIVLCDFGSCVTDSYICDTKDKRMEQEELVERNTTPLYRAPELVDLYSGKRISEKVDIWALGCILYALAFGKHAFDGGGTLGILSAKYSLPEHHGCSKKFLSLLDWLLNPNPDERPQVGDVTDYCEELTNCRKGPSAIERGSGVGARPSKKKKKKTDAVDHVTAKFQQTSVSSKKSSALDLARMRLARRQGKDDGMDAPKASTAKEVPFNPFEAETSEPMSPVPPAIDPLAGIQPMEMFIAQQPTVYPMQNPHGMGDLSLVGGQQQTDMFAGQQQTDMFTGQQQTDVFTGQQQTDMFTGQQQTDMFTGQQQTVTHTGQFAQQAQQHDAFAQHVQQQNPFSQPSVVLPPQQLDSFSQQRASILAAQQQQQQQNPPSQQHDVYAQQHDVFAQQQDPFQTTFHPQAEQPPHPSNSY